MARPEGRRARQPTMPSHEANSVFDPSSDVIPKAERRTNQQRQGPRSVQREASACRPHERFVASHNVYRRQPLASHRYTSQQHRQPNTQAHLLQGTNLILYFDRSSENCRQLELQVACRYLVLIRRQLESLHHEALSLSRIIADDYRTRFATTME